MIYLDYRDVNVQGIGIPHGGGAYTKAFELLLKDSKIQFEYIRAKSEIMQLRANDTLISASCYDLMRLEGVQAKKIYVVHGLRDHELVENNDYSMFRRLYLKFIKKQFKISGDFKNAKIIFPSITTKYMFELVYQTTLPTFSVAAAPNIKGHGDKYFSRIPANHNMAGKSFILLNADRFVKNFHRVYKACRIIKKTYGSSPDIYYTSKERLVNEANFHYLGFLSSEEFNSALQKHILLFPSLSEGYGLPLKDHLGPKIISGSLTLSWEHNTQGTVIINPRSVIELGAAMKMMTENDMNQWLPSNPTEVLKALLKEIL
ncbi:hypothetical protein OAP82_01295 [Paracoccaceae bacterium]|nr:hypothetical protein [Paracoccaceae bacterium]MDC0867649.1 hypothetical protein [Paracoccaceae bacterium]